MEKPVPPTRKKEELFPIAPDECVSCEDSEHVEPTQFLAGGIKPTPIWWCHVCAIGWAR